MKVYEVFEKTPPRIPERWDGWPLPDCRIGLEFEIENPEGRSLGRWWDNGELKRYWTTHTDGSLRDDGYEIVLKEELMGKELIDAITTLYATPWPGRATYRTSIHVHVDVRELDLEQMKTLFFAYALTEAGLYRFAGDERESSNYCVPWYFAPQYTEVVNAALFDGGMSKNNIRQVFGRAGRYSGLNVQALYKFGSIEFRHLGLTECNEEGKARILAWIRACMNLKKVAMTDIFEAVYEWQYMPKDFLYTRVYGEGTHYSAGVSDEAHELCQITANTLASYANMTLQARTLFTSDMVGDNPQYNKATQLLKERL